MLKSHIAGDRMWPRQLANTLWALAKMGLDDDEFIEPLFEQMERVRHAHLHVKVLGRVTPSGLPDAYVVVAD